MKFLGSIVMEREAGMGYGSSVPSGLEVSSVAEAARLHDSPRSTSVQPWPPVRFEAPPLSPGCAFAAEVAVDRIPDLRGEIERMREPTTSAAAQSSVRRTSVRFVDSAAMTVTHARGAGAFPRRGRG